jgi:hypothetical protein
MKVTKVNPILTHLRYIVLPSFTYEFTFPGSDRHYFDNALRGLRALGADPELCANRAIICHLASRALFGKLSFGRLLIEIAPQSSDEVTSRTTFLTYRMWFYGVALTLAVAVVVRSIYIADPLVLLLLPCIFISGHLYFWGVLPAKASRLKRFFRQLGE